MTALRVDGLDVEIDLPPAVPLAEALRCTGHAGVKLGCGEGTCGACTVVLDGAAVTSCLVPLARAEGRDVRTATSLATTPAGRAIATHLAARGALQCGYCAPGILAAACAAHPDGPAAPDAAGVPEVAGRPASPVGPVGPDGPGVLDGHLCRCTGYAGMQRALDRAAAGEPATAVRVDGLAKASATMAYAADVAPADRLYAALLTCRSAHALVTVEPGGALGVPGAVAVLGPDDAPDGRYSANPHVVDDVLAPLESAVFNREGRFAGDVVGVCVATTLHAAREMAALVVQREEPLAAVLDVDGAAALGAPLVQSAQTSNERFSYRVGDATTTDRALAAAVHTAAGSYEVQAGPVGAIETIAAAARWDGDVCTIWSTTQTAQVVGDRMGRLLGIPAARVHVQPVAIGGGFGLKEEVFLDHVAAVASRACGGRTVLVAPTRAQMDRLRSRHHFRFELASGCDDTGRLLGRRAAITLDAGGEVLHSALICHHVVGVARQLYPTPAVDVEGRVVLTNLTTTGSFRGYGTAELAFAVESNLDDLALAAGVDPLALRRRNLLRAGAVDESEGWVISSFASGACLDVLEARGWGTPLPSDERWRRGRGLATFTIVSATSSKHHADTSEARVRLDADGTVVVETGVAEMGTGNHTAFAEVAAERMGVPLGGVRVAHVGSADAPDDEGTFATRSVYVTSSAIAHATDALRSMVLDAAAAATGIPSQGLAIVDGVVHCGEATLPLSRFAPLEATAVYAAPDTGLVAGAQMVEVAVDAWTGRIVVERVVSVHDVGRVIDRDLATGQVEGGVVQAIGIALAERYEHEDGQPVRRTLLEEQLPRPADVPPIETVFVGDDGVRGPLGAKGLAEAPVVGIAAAIGNAIRDATGVRLTSVPFRPEVLWRALHAPAPRPPLHPPEGADQPEERTPR